MHDRGALLFGGSLRQPLDQLVHLAHGVGFRGPVLFGPATDLALEIIARLAVFAQAGSGIVHRVQLGERGIGGVIDGGALVLRHVR